MGPFLVARFARQALDESRRRVHQELHGRRGRRAYPSYRARRTLHTGTDLLTNWQKALAALFANFDHSEVEATWGIHQRLVGAYRNPVRTAGTAGLEAVIAPLGAGIRKVLIELRRLGRILVKRAVDVLAHFDRPGTFNGSDQGDQRATGAPPWVSPRLRRTSPTTSPDHYSRPASSDLNCRWIVLNPNRPTRQQQTAIHTSASSWCTAGDPDP